ncbi:MAG: hypothetical protein OES38_19305 [Gammaproteobacteria bacterium]|nr:hypothetical protein [Gammaproteobacteria bacterium]
MEHALPVTDVSQPYAVLSMGGRMLLLPQSEIRMLELVLDINTADQPVNGVGWLSFENSRWPVYCLNGELNPLTELPAARRICALLSLDDGYFGLVCAEVTAVQGDVRVRSLPAAMARPDSPLRGLALHGDRLGLVSTAAALAGFLGVGEAVDPKSGANPY